MQERDSTGGSPISANWKHVSSPQPSSASSRMFAQAGNDSDMHQARDAFRLPAAQISSSPSTMTNSRSTLWWGELEPWMDMEYAKQVCFLMGWDPVGIKVPHPTPDSTGQQANNPGYCFITFATPSHAAAALAQVNNLPGEMPVVMPNSNKPFLLNWASSTPVTPPVSPPNVPMQQQFPTEYSIFVGDLAPETSNSELVAVFRNPVLGLRSDREPKFIRPFTSCKSAKIMLDPVTGVSKGYGFVRFADEADQQRALIEMHGLYCLSRPMRISPATAKFKPPLEQPNASPATPSDDFRPALSIPHSFPAAPKQSALSPVGGSSNSGLPSSGSDLSMSAPPFTLASSGPIAAPASSSSLDAAGMPANAVSQIVQPASSGSNVQNSITAPFAQSQQQQQFDQVNAARYGISEESWKHQARAQAILNNLIGPNGEQLTTTDPYNTTVFVGGLSPLISEETLRTFFAPFGDIHYVKVPPGKHCGFVQFVRKADAERAIEKMQGFPIGGSRIRLSWGRSQYKAAQAAALQAQMKASSPSPAPSVASGSSRASGSSGTSVPQMLTAEQALELLQKWAFVTPTGSAGLDEGDRRPPNVEALRELLLTKTKEFNTRPEPNNRPEMSLNANLDVDLRPRPQPGSFDFSQGGNSYMDQGRRDSAPILSSENFPTHSTYRSFAPSFGAVPHEALAPLTSPSANHSAYDFRSRYPSQRFGSADQMGINKPSSAVVSRPQSNKQSIWSRGNNEYFDPQAQVPVHDLSGPLADINLGHGSSPWKTQERDSNGY